MRVTTAAPSHPTFVRADVIPAFFTMLDKKYGGVEAYLKQYLDLTDDDISTIRRHLLTLPNNL